MSEKTGIQWTDATWNPIRGCSMVSAGCAHCYAQTVAARFSGAGLPYEGLTTDGKWNGQISVVEKHFTDPLRWMRPRKIFVNSMSDLFHKNVPDSVIDRAFAVMALVPRHTFQILTKRPERMLRYLTTPRECGGYAGDPVVGAQMHVAWRAGRLVEDGDCAADSVSTGPWPLPNVWLGVSVEDQATADARIPLLLETPAAKRFVSYEPALGPADFTRCLPGPGPGERTSALLRWTNGSGSTGLDWIIVGGESGPGARQFDVGWARSTVKQCRAAGVACFVKQLGAQPIGVGPLGGSGKVTDRKGGDVEEWPKDLVVREFPQ